jgi:hypothetical protein
LLILDKKSDILIPESKKEAYEMNAIDPNMTFAQVVQFYKEYVKKAKSCGRKPVSFLRYVTGRY